MRNTLKTSEASSFVNPGDWYLAKLCHLLDRQKGIAREAFTLCSFFRKDINSFSKTLLRPQNSP